MQPAILDDVPTREKLRGTITHYFNENNGTASSSSIEWEAFKTVIRGTCIHNAIGVAHTLRHEVEVDRGFPFAAGARFSNRSN